MDGNSVELQTSYLQKPKNKKTNINNIIKKKEIKIFKKKVVENNALHK